MVRAFGFFSALFVVLGCSGQSVRSDREPNVSAPQFPRVQLIFSPSRRANVDPCGCSINPVGGLVREANALKLLRAREGVTKSLYLVSGPALVGEERPVKATGEKKAEILIQAMNQLEVAAYSPSADDFSLGADTVKRLATASRFPWVSSNLTWKGKGKSVFQPFIELELPGGQKALVMGISKAALSWLKSPQVAYRDPAAAIEKILASPAGGADLKIVLSSLSQSENAGLLDRFPMIHVLLGGDGIDPMLDAAQENIAQLRAEPDARGRALAFFEVATPLPKSIPQFYNSAMAKQWASLDGSWRDSLYRAESNLRKNPKHSESGKWTKQAARLKRWLALMPQMYKPDPAAVNYAYGVWQLGSEYDGDNAMSPLVSNFLKYVTKTH